MTLSSPTRLVAYRGSNIPRRCEPGDNDNGFSSEHELRHSDSFFHPTILSSPLEDSTDTILCVSRVRMCFIVPAMYC